MKQQEYSFREKMRAGALSLKTKHTPKKEKDLNYYS